MSIFKDMDAKRYADVEVGDTFTDEQARDVPLNIDLEERDGVYVVVEVS